MHKIWVYKADGTIQCTPAGESEISLDEMRKDLADLIGDKNILDQQKRGPQSPVVTLCGHPTGNVNAYQITPEGLHLLFSGIRGPCGFEVDQSSTISANQAGGPIFPWPTEGGKTWADDRFVPWPWVAMGPNDADAAGRAFLNVISSLTQAGAVPAQIQDLIGRVCRVYNEGDMITMDYAPQRVNIVLKDRRITRVWFG